MEDTYFDKEEFSSGGVVYQDSGHGMKYLLGLHSGYKKWVLPKGLIEKGETEFQTAVRETEEEMGVVAQIIDPEPLLVTTYTYTADFKDKVKDQEAGVVEKNDTDTRKVKTYQEDGIGKTRVKKTVTFFLMEAIAGDPSLHGWEMNEVGWFSYDDALEMMSFDGEKEALKKAKGRVEY